MLTGSSAVIRDSGPWRLRKSPPLSQLWLGQIILSTSQPPSVYQDYPIPVFMFLSLALNHVHVTFPIHSPLQNRTLPAGTAEEFGAGGWVAGQRRRKLPFKSFGLTAGKPNTIASPWAKICFHTPHLQHWDVKGCTEPLT